MAIVLFVTASLGYIAGLGRAERDGRDVERARREVDAARAVIANMLRQQADLNARLDAVRVDHAGEMRELYERMLAAKAAGQDVPAVAQGVEVESARPLPTAVLAELDALDDAEAAGEFLQAAQAFYERNPGASTAEIIAAMYATGRRPAPVATPDALDFDLDAEDEESARQVAGALS